jgi:hypothetical protein
VQELRELVREVVDGLLRRDARQVEAHALAHLELLQAALRVLIRRRLILTSASEAVPFLMLDKGSVGRVLPRHSHCSCLMICKLMDLQFST